MPFGTRLPARAGTSVIEDASLSRSEPPAHPSGRRNEHAGGPGWSWRLALAARARFAQYGRLIEQTHWTAGERLWNRQIGCLPKDGEDSACRDRRVSSL